MDMGILIVGDPVTGIWTMRKQMSDEHAIIFLESVTQAIRDKETNGAVDEIQNLINGKAQ